ncbi:unnamed protein product [Orchesella dallaii]|uniref:Protein ARV n=2 Tax=Orchesella dallaii TaxID=48710 RepID=A0ABP1QRP9_9HEXA
MYPDFCRFQPEPVGMGKVKERRRSSSGLSSKPDKMYTCVHCGHLSPHIYKTYALSSENLMKLLECRKCGKLVDKYIEYDVIIVAVNLLLLHQPAYRHVLLNDPFSSFWKLGIIFPFCEAYCHWCFQKGMETSPNRVDFYELENDFYRVLLRTAIGAGVFHLFILITSFIRSCLFRNMVRQNFSYMSVLKGTCMCGFYSVFELVSLVWSFKRMDSQYVFIYGIQWFTNVQSYIATTTASSPTSYLIVGIAIGLKLIALQLFDDHVPVLDF